MTQLEDALLHIGKKDVISGIFSSVNDLKYYYYHCDLIVNVQISTDKLNKDSTGNLCIAYCTLSSNSSSNDGLITSYMERLS